jgi:hypothetical protein
MPAPCFEADATRAMPAADRNQCQRRVSRRLFNANQRGQCQQRIAISASAVFRGGYSMPINAGNSGCGSQKINYRPL